MKINMRIILLSILLSSLCLTRIKAEEHENGKDSINLNLEEICKTESCKTSIKSIQEKHKNIKPGKLAEQVLSHVQNEFGKTTMKIRSHMEKDSTPGEVKKALSHCLKMYLDIAHELRGAYLAIKTKKFGPEATEFGTMAKRFPALCEHGLVKADTSGKQWGLYTNSYDQNDLIDMANSLEAIINIVAAHKKH